jgi:hypothetical protein
MIAGSDFKLLSDDVHVFPQTPPWQQAMAAHQVLMQARLGVGSAAELEDHLLLLSEFVQMLRDNLEAVGPALLNASFLAGVRPVDKFDVSLPKALRILSTGLQFASIGSTRLKQALQVFQAHVEGLDKPLPPPPGFSSETGELLGDSTDPLQRAYTQGQEFAEKHDWTLRASEAWQQLLQRLAAHERGGGTTAAGFDEILCAAYLAGPARHLPLQLSDASLHAWSRAMIKGMRPRSAKPAEDDVPFGIVAHALLQSGFGRFDISLIESLCSTIQSAAGASAEEGAALRSTLFESRSMKRETAPAGAVVFVRKKEMSVTESWTEVPSRALFVVLTFDEFKQEMAQSQSILLMLPSPTLLVWERSDEGVNETDVQVAGGKLRQAQFQVLDPSRSQALATPRGPDELVSIMRS